MGSKSKQGVRRSDESIQTEILDRLTSDPEVDASEIEIEVENGNVILRGEVVDSEMKEAVETVVRKVAGVHRLNDRLYVGDSPFDPSFAAPLRD